jgi:hypothetical protein
VDGFELGGGFHKLVESALGYHGLGQGV